MTFAKGLANGFAIGGVVGRGDLLDGIRGNGISTFGGNPIATTAGQRHPRLRALPRPAEATPPPAARSSSPASRTRPASLKTVADVRGKGLMFAVDLADPATGKPSPQLAAKAMEETKKRGLLIGKGGLYGATLRMAPPLTLSEAEAREGLGLLVDALEAVGRGQAVSARLASWPTKHVTHWIGGKPWTGSARRARATSTTPPPGQVTGARRLRLPRRTSTTAVAAASAAWRCLALGVRCPAGRDGPVRLPRAGQEPRERARGAHHRRARQGRSATPPARSPAALRSSSSPAASRTCSRAASPRTSRPASTSYSIRQPARRRGRDHPVQLPRHGADVDVPDRDRLRQRLRAQAVGEGPVRVDAARPAAGPRPACPTACSTWSTVTRSRSTRSSTHPDIAAVSFVGSTPIARYVYETGTQRGQAGAGARRREEPHGRPARRRPRPGRRRGGLRRVRHRAGERCMAVSALVAVDPIGDELVAQDQGPGRQAARRPRQRRALARWGRWSPAPTGTRSPPTSTPASRQGATLVVDGRGTRSSARRQAAAASGSARRCSTT